MCTYSVKTTTWTFASMLFLIGLSNAAHAVDGVVLIDQNSALAGGVTSGDTPGFPITISESGSYRLSSNLIVPASTNGITISANEVTLDLNGFSIIASGVSTGAYAINAYTTGANNRPIVRVLNGIIDGFPNAISIQSEGYVDNVQIEQAIAPAPAGGVNIAMSYGTITRSSVRGVRAAPNTFTMGIACYVMCLISGNRVTYGDVGIYTQESLIIGNIVVGTASYGIQTNGPGGGLQDNYVYPSSGSALSMLAINMGHNVCGSSMCP